MAETTKTQVTEVTTHECFQIAKVEKTYRIILGDAIISQKQFKTLDEAKKYINKKPYELIFNGSIYINKQIKTLEK